MADYLFCKSGLRNLRIQLCIKLSRDRSIRQLERSGKRGLWNVDSPHTQSNIELTSSMFSKKLDDMLFWPLRKLTTCIISFCVLTIISFKIRLVLQDVRHFSHRWKSAHYDSTESFIKSSVFLSTSGSLHSKRPYEISIVSSEGIPWTVTT